MDWRTKKLILLGSASTLALGLGASPILAQALDDEGEFLGEIVLERGKREVQTETAIPVTVINQEEIDDRQAATVAELIDTVPGVTLINGTTPQSSGINIRGFGADGTYGTSPRLMVVIDGATTGGEEIYRLGNQLFTDPAIYKDVTVIRGPVGTFEYGSGAVGGVIEFNTKDASDFTLGEIGFAGRQLFEFQSNGEGFTSSTILAWKPTENFDLIANYTLRDNNAYEDGSGTTIANSDFRNYTGFIKGRLTFGQDDDHAVTAWYNNTSADDNNVPYDILGASSGFYFGDVDRAVDSETAGLRYEYNPLDNDLINFSATLTYAEQYVDSTYIPGSCAGFPGCDSAVEDLLNADHDYETTKLTLKNENFLITGGATHDLVYGFEYTHRERADAASAPGGTDKRWAFFAVDDIQINDALTITPALRYESQKVNGTDEIADGETDPYNGSWSNDALVGGISARYAFQSGFAVFASAAYTEVFPIIDRLDKDSSVWVPEKGTTYEAGFSYQGQDIFAAGDNLGLKVNFYDTNLRDVRIAGDILTVVDTKGVELEASYGQSNGFYLDLNATVGDGKQTTPGGVVSDWAFSPEPNAGITIGKRFGDTWDVSWEQRIAKGSESLNNTGYLSGYGVSNLRATYMPQDGVLEGTEIRVGIENLFDREYRTQLSTENAPGRNFKLSLAKSF